ncbi:MAG TPA: VUT family protein [Firmicutes bacterium]|nr:VUT family protein [Bacillota bacterium]
MSQKLKTELHEFELLLRSVPSTITVLFVMSVFAMNLLANKSIALPFDWLALDCGIIVSWLSFLTMDMIVRHFGPKAATELSIFAILLNLFWCMIFYIASMIPGSWGESYVAGSEALLNSALDNTFGGTWYVLAGSTAAFLLSSVVNNFVNWGIGKRLGDCNLVDRGVSDHSSSDRGVSERGSGRRGFGSYALRSYLSTAIAQFVDNLTFALLVSHIFFGWSLLQCVTCSLTGMVVELLCEVGFSFFGYRICRGWEKKRVGEEYFKYRKKCGASMK